MKIKSLFSLHLHRVGVEGSSPIDGGIVAAPSTMLREQQLLQRGRGGGGGEAAPSVRVRVRVFRRCVSSPPLPPRPPSLQPHRRVIITWNELQVSKARAPIARRERALVCVFVCRVQRFERRWRHQQVKPRRQRRLRCLRWWRRMLLESSRRFIKNQTETDSEEINVIYVI